MGKVSRARAVVIAACWLMQAATAGATVGGPEVATILGWNPADRKVYYIVHFHDESDRPPRVFFLDLKSSKPGKAVPLRLWPEGTDQRIDYGTIDSKTEALRKSLVPLRVSAPDTLDLSITTRIAQEKWKDRDGAVRGRYEQELVISHGSLKGRTKVTSFCNREIQIKEWYEIPGLPFAIAHLSYTGMPWESCYGRSAVLLLTAGAGVGN